MRALLAGALLLSIASAGRSAQPADGPGDQALTVELSSFALTPATLTLRQGTHYRLRFVNTSSGGHNFVAKEFFAASTVAADDVSKVHDGSVEVGGGKTVEVRLTPNQAGSYKSRCSHFMHSSFGMKGEIVVQPAG